ncbi:hypothetical protein ABOM_002694 [Aspergillus bombycis]|uniref:Uncharacterized protein n=1 Tax=Aspergillus bombycis TaxID=109264 RepID=A0A1F8A9E9_9EURO|nr:hypothetical protein ABOM_002694 [Aspergillus bombycis]OGM47918.1 hypothetical protein ABOM_002694 [Aspergillus bombycis]
MFVKKALLGLAMAMAPTAVLGLDDFWLGSYSGEGLAGTWGNPGSLGMCYYTIVGKGVNQCDATRLNPSDGSGGCPGQNGHMPNFCHMAIAGGGVPNGYELDRNGGDCPMDNSRSDGTWYADVVDTNNGNAKVGRCVYEFWKGPNCASTGSFLTETFVHCYQD